MLDQQIVSPTGPTDKLCPLTNDMLGHMTIVVQLDQRGLLYLLTNGLLDQLTHYDWLDQRPVGAMVYARPMAC